MPGGYILDILVAIVKQKEFASRCCSSLFVFPANNNMEIDGIGFVFFYYY